MKLTIEQDMLEHFLPVLGAEVTDDGFVRDIESGEICTTPDGEKITIDEVGYIDYDESVVLVEDDFSAIVSEASDRR